MKIGILPSINDNQVNLNLQYLRYAEKLGGEVSIINLNHQVESVDWLWISGGADVDPTMFGYDNISSIKVHRPMDEFQSACIDLALENRIPIFGICRGFQLLAYKFLVGNNAWIVQHVSGHNQMDNNLHRDDKFHAVDCKDGTSMFVNSMHHQALVVLSNNIPEWVTHTIRYKKGEIIVEGFDFTIAGTQIQGVQWHPEELMEEFPLELPNFD